MANANSPSNYKRTARILTVACGLLFFLFSFVYLYVLQKDVLQAVHYSFSDGRTRLDSFWIALVLTSALLLLGRGVNALLGLKGAIRSLAYFPSFLLLGALTDVDYSVYQEGIAPYWSWLLPLLLLVFLLSVFVLRRVFRWWVDREIDGGIMACSNFFLLLMLCFMTVSIGNTDIHFHHRLAAEAALRADCPEKVRGIGAKVVDPTRWLTVLRGYALSREGRMGEYLFRVPQLYGADGLMPDATDQHILSLSADSLYTLWGADPLPGERAVDYFHRLCSQEKAPWDYYLSALLLDKQLSTFADSLRTLYPVENLPHYYREALFLYQQMHPSDEPSVTDEAMEQQWQAYQGLKQELSGKEGVGNRLRRKFGQTYWWYFEHF